MHKVHPTQRKNEPLRIKIATQVASGLANTIVGNSQEEYDSVAKKALKLADAIIYNHNAQCPSAVKADAILSLLKFLDELQSSKSKSTSKKAIQS